MAATTRVNTLRPGSAFRFSDGTEAELVYVNECRAYVRKRETVCIKGKSIQRHAYWNVCPEMEVTINEKPTNDIESEEDMNAYKTRDNAVAVLRKMGIKPADYDKFIAKEDGKFAVNREAAERSFAKPAKGKTAESKQRAVPPAEAPPQKIEGFKSPAPPKERVTIKQVVIGMLLGSPTIPNDELIAAVKARFPESAFSETHAAWYRAQARKGKLTGTPMDIPTVFSKRHSRKPAEQAAEGKDRR